MTHAASAGARRPNVFTIPSDEPFLRVLAGAILDGGLPRPGGEAPSALGLSDIQLLLPTRRAVRSLSETFLELSDGVRLLPRMTPLGDVDEDELLLAAEVSEDAAAQALGHRPAIAPLERRLILTRLVLQWVEQRGGGTGPSVRTPAQAAWLAADLARLIDMFDTEQADWSDLDGLVEKELSSHWDDALEFLSILRVVLPELMEARGLMQPMVRRNLLLAAQAGRLEAADAGTPVIAAGSTGSIPATANLLQAVSRLERGAVVLPGLDLHLDEAAWAEIGPAHPQFGLKQLLDRIGIDREAVAVLGGREGPSGAGARAVFLSEVMRPADASERWRDVTAAFDARGALDGLSLINAPSQREEALAIALIMRQALDTAGRSVALVTPDRRLARRVSAELVRWDIEVDDSAGTPLISTPPATFLLLLLEAAESGFAAVPLLGLLKHPLCAFGRTTEELRGLAGLIEIAALRGLAPRAGLEGLRRALASCRNAAASGGVRLHPTVEDIQDEGWDRADALIGDLQACFEPLSELLAQGRSASPQAVVSAHIACAESACRRAGADPDKGLPLWRDEAGEALAQFLAGLLEAAEMLPPMSAGDYPPLLSALMQGHVVRRRYGQHPRLHIWGLLEARLMQADVMILGGLTEGSWPPVAITDPWLNRPMRAGLDLEPPERRIGLTAHDFVQAASAPRVYLTLADKIDGSPAVPSRWVHRLAALLKPSGGDAIRDDSWVSWAQGMDNAERYTPIPAPKPKPPVSARPRRMSVTRVETWVRDPYAIFARDILDLAPLDPLATAPSAADRGTIIHAILHRAARLEGGVTEADLLAQGAEVFAGYIDYPDVAAFWWPRFQRIARWLVEQDLFSTQGVARRLAEVSGKLVLDAPAGAFKLTARADRIDIRDDGSARILDYKTGQPPSGKQAASGLAPQMPLEAAIAMRGGFEDTPALDVSELTYIRVSGGEPPGEVKPISRDDPAVLAEKALEGLSGRIAHFDDPATPYLPRTAVERERQERDYDHLARHLEWARLAADGADT